MSVGLATSDSLPCPGCGYDLRGNPETELCPECGCDVFVTTERQKDTAITYVKLLKGSALISFGGLTMLAFGRCAAALEPVFQAVPLTLSLFAYCFSIFQLLVAATLIFIELLKKGRRSLLFELGMVRWVGLNVLLLLLTSLFFIV